MTRMSNTKAFLLIGFTAGVIMTALTYEAKAAFFDGNALLDRCKTSRVAAISYVVGAIDLMEVQDPSFRGLYPQTATAGQLTDVVCQFLQNTPEKRHVSAAALVAVAIGTAF